MHAKSATKRTIVSVPFDMKAAKSAMKQRLAPGRRGRMRSSELRPPGRVSYVMLRRLIIAAVVAALGAAAPASAQSPLNEYQQTGQITPCRYSAGQLNASVPNDVAQYAPEYQTALQTAARQRASCAGASGGSAGQGASGGSPSGGAPGSGSSRSTASGTSGAAATAAVSATRARQARERARTRHRALVRARSHLAAATIAPEAMAADGRVPDWALLIAALPILALLALAGAIRGRELLARRRAAGQPDAIPAAHSRGLVSGTGNGNGSGNGHGVADQSSAEAPTEEVDALPARSGEIEDAPAPTPVREGAKD
jgi:hypothetical protein